MKFFYLILFLFIGGCISQNAELDLHKKKPFKIVFTADVTDAEAAGGLMIWGKNSNGDSFARAVSNKTVTVDANGGSWTWYAMAWTGENGVDQNANGNANDPLAGTIKCAVTPQTLSGQGKRAITLSFSNGNCTDSAFVGTDSSVVEDVAGVKYLARVKVQFCQALTAVNSYDDTCTDDLLIDITRVEARGHAMSYRLSLVSYDRDNGSTYQFGSETLVSSCVSGIPSVADSGRATKELWQVPSGIQGSATPFYIKMEAFPGSATCDSSTHGKATVSFPTGIAYNSPGTKQFIDTTLPLGKQMLFVKMAGDEICYMKEARTQTYGGGDGTANSPYLICNVNQLYNMYPDNGTTVNNYKLLADIDLTSYYQGVNKHPSQPTHTCLKDGSNFFPLGFNTFSCTGLGNYDNTIDGGGKTIKGMRIIMPGTAQVGFIGKANNGYIRRLKFENAYVEGLSEAGVIAGQITGSQHLSDFEVTGSEVKISGSRVGGAFGYLRSNSNAFNVKVSKTKVISTAGSYAGGIIGQFFQFNSCHKCTFSGDVRSQSISGGLVGGISDAFGGSITNSSFEGYVEGNASVGGIAGEAGLMKFQGISVHGNIHARNFAGPIVGVSGQMAGGLIGRVGTGPGATSYIKDSYFFGRVSHSCSNNTVACFAGNILGLPTGDWLTPTANFSNVYYNLPEMTATMAGPINATGLPGSDFYNLNFMNGTYFTSRLGDIPRVKHLATDHPCRANGAFESVAVQTAAPYNRGTSASPVLLCNGDQILEIQSNASLHYKLLTYVSDFTPMGNASVTLSGTIDGDGYGIIGQTFEAVSNNQSNSWFANITGTVKNLSLLGPYLSNGVFAGGSASTLSTFNTGTISHVKVLGLQSTFIPTFPGGAAGLVNSNLSSIVNVEINGIMVGFDKTYGLTAQNLGTIRDVKNSLYFFSFGAGTNIAAFVGDNGAGAILNRVTGSNKFLYAVDIAASNNISKLVTTNSGSIGSVHLTSNGYFRGSGDANHAIAKTNSGTIIGVVNETETTILDRTSVPNGAPANDAEWEQHISATFGSNTGTANGIYYLNDARWNYPLKLLPGPANGGTAPVVVATECNFEMKSTGTSIENTPLWANFIDTYVGFSGFYVTDATNYLGPLKKEIVSRNAPANTAGFDEFNIQQPTNNCADLAVQQYVTYVAFDRTNTALTPASLLVWSPWHIALSAFVSISRTDVPADLESIHETIYKQLNGRTVTEPTWIFEPGVGIKLYERK
ncbi:MAG: hypothetical protein V4598_11375 [Bdellovibrionota bacterium]